MNHIKQTENFIDYMQNHVLDTIKSALQNVPEDKIDYKPEGDLNSLKFLFYHVINSPFIYLSGIGKETFSSADFNVISLDLDKKKSKKDLINYYSEFSTFLENFKSKLKPTMLDNMISYNLEKVGWGSWNLTGQRALETAFEEMIHHRGQIYIYLRILGIKPPLIYPYL